MACPVGAHLKSSWPLRPCRPPHVAWQNHRAGTYPQGQAYAAFVGNTVAGRPTIRVPLCPPSDSLRSYGIPYVPIPSSCGMPHGRSPIGNRRESGLSQGGGSVSSPLGKGRLRGIGDGVGGSAAPSETPSLCLPAPQESEHTEPLLSALRTPPMPHRGSESLARRPPCGATRRGGSPTRPYVGSEGTS